MSPAKTLCCEPDPREAKERVINSQELPQTASSRSIRAPCSSCLSSRQRWQKRLRLHSLSLNNLHSKGFPLSWLAKHFSGSPHRCYSQPHTRWEALKRNSKLIPLSWWSNTKKMLLKDSAFYFRLPLQGNLQFPHRYYSAESDTARPPRQVLSLGSSWQLQCLF